MHAISIKEPITNGKFCSYNIQVYTSRETTMILLNCPRTPNSIGVLKN